MIGKSKKRWVLFAGLLFMFTGCAFHSTSKNWSGLMGIDGKPAYYKKTSKVAFNLFVMVPLLGNISVDGMVEDLTEAIAEENGNNVRIVQGGSENYWYGFPPFTWILTPVVTTVSAEYTPNSEIYIVDQAVIRSDEEHSNGLNPVKW